MLQTDAVVVYEQRNFGGQARTLGVGDHRMDNWKPSSIHIPQGFVAYLYQYVDDAGGYGTTVDLMEPQADLSNFGLAGDVAQVMVFRAEKPEGFVWARGRIRGGEFVPGHWERRRASGRGPDNSVAVASVVPSRAAYLPTKMQQQGGVWTITHLGKQSREGALLWARAQQQLGVIGNDYRGPQYIGSAPVERASNNLFIPDTFNIWYPNPVSPQGPSSYHKRTLAGIITPLVTARWPDCADDDDGDCIYALSKEPRIYTKEGTFEDFDVNIDIAPFVDYQYLIKESHKPEKSTLEGIKELVYEAESPCTEPFIRVEAEVDMAASARIKLVDGLKRRVGKPLAVYGAWVYDVGHCHQPEIHPAEQIWWMDNTPAPTAVRQYHLNVFADSSKRFWWRDQFDSESGSLTVMRPWGAPPLKGVFAIAFEVLINPMRATAQGKQFRLSNVDLKNVQSLPEAHDVYNLVFGGNTLISFLSNTLNFNVSFEHVGFKEGSNNIVRGFLVIETTVGAVRQKTTILDGREFPMGTDPDSVPRDYERQLFEKEAGHYMFRLTEVGLANELEVLRPQ